MVALKSLLLVAFSASGAHAALASSLNSARDDLIFTVGAAAAVKAGKHPKPYPSAFVHWAEQGTKRVKNALTYPGPEACDLNNAEYGRYSKKIAGMVDRFAPVACDARFAGENDRAEIVRSYEQLRDAVAEVAVFLTPRCPGHAVELNARAAENVAQFERIIAAFAPIQAQCIV